MKLMVQKKYLKQYMRLQKKKARRNMQRQLRLLQLIEMSRKRKWNKIKL